MFDFFVKKKYLVDYLGGFTDIHNHILPGIDDGAKNIEESLSLIKGMGELGVSDFICTPHIMENYYPNTPETINSALHTLEKALKTEENSDVRIRAAAEHMVDSGFENLVLTDSLMPIAKQYVLVEMSYLQASLNFEHAINLLSENGYFPIFAHPERYVYLHRGKGNYHKMKKQGLLFQLNLLSLGGYYGKDVFKKAISLLDDKLVDFVGTDIHHMNHLKSLKNIQINTKVLDMVIPLIERTNYNFG